MKAKQSSQGHGPTKMPLRQYHGVLLRRSPMAGRHRVVLHHCVGGDGGALVGYFLYRDSPYAYPVPSPCRRRPLPCHRRHRRHSRRHHRRHHRCHRLHPPSVIAPSDDVGAIGAQPLLERVDTLRKEHRSCVCVLKPPAPCAFRSALVRYRGKAIRQSVCVLSP